jgi:hypothetical protein
MALQVRTPEQMQALFDRSLAKSDEQARAGNLPRLLRHNAAGDAVFSVASRTTGGAIYLLVAEPNGVACDCQALGYCWHVAHVERAIAGEIGMVIVQPRPLVPASAAALSGKA